MTASPLNAYGDALVPTTGQHGADIASQRMDDLDKDCLAFIKQNATRKPFIAIDIGGGAGAQSKRMAELGADVLLIDLSNQRENIDTFNRAMGREAIHFIRQDVRGIAPWPDNIQCVYSQRMLNYLPYGDALALLKTLISKSGSGTGFFISTGGIDTEYGLEYPDRDKPVEDRFVLLSAPMAAKHNITCPVCLYREAELRQLAERAGLTIDHSWTSPFGNPKVVATNP